jgi:hypothetical protein
VELEVALLREPLGDPVFATTACIVVEDRFVRAIGLLAVNPLENVPAILVSIQTSSTLEDQSYSTCICVYIPFLITLIFLHTHIFINVIVHKTI